MYSASDFEKLWFLDKTGGEPKGISLNSFCSSHGVHYAQFNTWFRKTQYTERVDKFVRIDCYSIGDKLYFGELTYHPECGMIDFHPDEWDYKVGEWLELPKA